MEITSPNLLDSIIYRANVFNYDNKFLTEIRDRNLKFDLTNYNNESKTQSTLAEKGISFLKQKSKDQISQLLTLLLEIEESSIDN
jgi:hypothetical protein